MNRSSVDSITRQGVTKTIQAKDGTFKNTYSNATSPQYAADPSAVYFASNKLEKNFYNSFSYNIIVGKFLNAGSSHTNAHSMAKLVIDVAKLKNIDARDIQISVVDGKIDLPNDILLYMNILRDPSSKVVKLLTGMNRRSILGREIIG